MEKLFPIASGVLCCAEVPWSNHFVSFIGLGLTTCPVICATTTLCSGITSSGAGGRDSAQPRSVVKMFYATIYSFRVELVKVVILASLRFDLSCLYYLY